VLTKVARWYLFKPKIPNFGQFWSVLQRKMLVSFMHIWSNLLPLHMFYFVYCKVILVYFSRFGMLQQEKSGNPGAHPRR
jgi:hypothetical protein